MTTGSDSPSKTAALVSLAAYKEAVKAREWEAAKGHLAAAYSAGLTITPDGVPLTFLEQDLARRRQDAAERRVRDLIAQAEHAQTAGDFNRSRALYTRAQHISNVSRDTQRTILAATELLDTSQILAGGEPDSSHRPEDAALGDLLKQLLATIRDKKPNLYTLLDLCAVPLWLDEGVLAVLRGREDGTERSVLERLSCYSFFYEWVDRFSLSRETRHALLADWSADPDGFLSINRQLLTHFEGRLATDPPRDPVRLERLIQSQLYHTMIVDPDAGIGLLGRLFQQAQDDYRLPAARQYLMICKDMQPLLSPGVNAYITYFEGWYHQLKGNRNAAAQIFERLSRRPDLVPELRARVLRGLAVTLVQERRWVEAIEQFKAALALFGSLGNQPEMAYTMNGLGNAYLDLAITTRGQGDNFDPVASYSPWVDRLVGFLQAMARLPLILYLVFNLNLSMGPLSLRRLGLGMDWAIARLFSDAILWFRQARVILERVGNTAGVDRVDDNLAHLYLEINHPRQAKQSYQALLDSAAVMGTYREARTRLEQAEASLRLGEWADARRLLDLALPTFVDLRHQRRIAQTQTRLGHLAVVEKDYAAAMTAYAKALDAWRKDENDEEVTNVLHNMEALADRLPKGSPEPEVLTSARSKTSARTYSIRYAHPVMQIFKRLAVVGLILTMAFVVMISLRTESGAQLGADMALNLPLQEEKEGGFGPEVEYTLQQQIVPKANSNLTSGAPWLIGETALIYLALYTLLGLYVINTLSLSAVQAHQRVRLALDDEGIHRINDDGESVAIKWADVITLLRADRRLRTILLHSFSATAVLGPGLEIVVPGYTNHYPHVVDRILERLSSRGQTEVRPIGHSVRSPWARLANRLTRRVLADETVEGVVVLDMGFTVVRSFAGWFFILSFLGLLGFVAVVVFNPARLIMPLFGGLPYALVDVYALLYLGIGLPLLYWFVLLIARWELVQRPLGGALSGLGLLAIITSIFAYSQTVVLHLPLGRPDLVWVASAVLTILFTVRTVWIARKRQSPESAALHGPLPHLAKEAAYSLATRLIFTGLGVVLLVAVIDCAIMEVRSYNSLAQANGLLTQAETLRIKQPQAAAVLYAQATQRYDASLAMRSTPNIFNSLGAAYVQLGKLTAAGVTISDPIYLCDPQATGDPCPPRQDLSSDDLFQAAVTTYQLAWTQQPDELTYGINVALADQTWASVQTTFGETVARYKEALTIYDDVVGRVEANPGRYATLGERVREYRAAANYNLATKIYSLQTGWEDSFPYYQAAAQDYHWLIENAKDTHKQAVAYAGLGWTKFYLRYQVPKENLDGRDPYLKQAIDDYQTGIRLDPTYGALYNGLGWAEYYKVFSHPARCGTTAQGDPDRERYIQGIVNAIAAFEQGTQVDTANGTYYRTLAQLNYILAYCNPEYERIPQLLLSLDDYDQAIKRAPQAIWFYRQGTINLELGNNYRDADQTEEAQGRYELAKTALLNAVADNPLEPEYWHWVYALYGSNYLNLGRTGFVDVILAAAKMTPTYDNLLKLGSQAIARDQRQYLGRLFLNRAVDVNPAGAQALALLAQDRFDQQDYPTALDFAKRAVAADALDGPTQLLLGRTYLRLGRYAESVQVLQTAAALAPQSYDPRLALGWAAYKAGEDALAGRALTAAIDLAPDDPQPRFFLGLVEVAQGDRAAAAAAYAQATATANALTDEAKRRDVYDEAITDLLAVRADPANLAGVMVDMVVAALSQPVADAGGDVAAFYAQEAAAALTAGRTDFAIRLWQRARTLDPQNGDYALQMGQAMESQGDYAAALPILKEAATLLPASAEAHRLYGWTAYHQGGQLLALGEVGTAVTLDPANAQARFNLGVVLAKAGRWIQATETISAGVAVANQSPDRATLDRVYGELTQELRTLRTPDTAQNVDGLLRTAGDGYILASVNKPFDYRTYWMTGWDLYTRGLYDLSAAMSAQAVILNPADPRVRFNQGLAELAAGDGERATATYAAGIETAATFTDGVARLTEGLGDLRANKVDPAGVAPTIIALLEKAVAGE